MDGPGFEPHGGKFSGRISFGLEAPAGSRTMGPGSFPTVKRPKPEFDHTTSSSVPVEYV
jgi:hypothetical protein